MVYSGFETALDRELPGEIESLIFCIQTGIGVGIIAFIMGRFVERKKWTDSLGDNAFEVLRKNKSHRRIKGAMNDHYR